MQLPRYTPEVRRTLGVENQRQWADQAIARTTPCLPALFSLVTLLADRLVRRGTLLLPQDAWYTKRRRTFADALATVRQHYGTHTGFRVSGRREQIGKPSNPCESASRMHFAVRLMAKVELTATPSIETKAAKDITAFVS